MTTATITNKETTAKGSVYNLSPFEIAKLNQSTQRKAHRSEVAKARPVVIKSSTTITDDRRLMAREAKNSYQQLDGEWQRYFTYASRYALRIPPEDREDFTHDCMIVMYHASQSKEVTNMGLMRIANCQIADYWRERGSLTACLDCGDCSVTQRIKCKRNAGMGALISVCPKAVKVESLNRPIVDNNGEITEYGELITDDSVNLDCWLDAHLWLMELPARLIEIADKIRQGEPLAVKDRVYLSKQRAKYLDNKEQQKIF